MSFNFFKIVSTILAIAFPYIFYDQLVNSYKKACLDFDWNYNESTDQFGKDLNGINFPNS